LSFTRFGSREVTTTWQVSYASWRQTKKSAGRLRYPQPVEGEQGDGGVFVGRAEPGGDQYDAEFVAVRGGGVRLIVQAGAADVRGRGVLVKFFFDGVLVRPLVGLSAQNSRICASGAAWITTGRPVR
jgi:hypothetical protein